MNRSVLSIIAEKHRDKIIKPYDAIFEECGLDAILAYCGHFGGLTVYMPSVRRIFGSCIAHEVRSEFNGMNYKALAIKYDVCESYIRKIVSFAK